MCREYKLTILTFQETKRRTYRKRGNNAGENVVGRKKKQTNEEKGETGLKRGKNKQMQI